MSIFYPNFAGNITGSGGITADDAITSNLKIAFPSPISSGSVLYIQPTNGEVELADQDGSGTREVVGIALNSPVINNIKVVTRYGSIVTTTFSTGPTSSAQIGTPVYLSSTPGQATMATPVSGTVYRLGVLYSDVDQGGGKYKILFMPVKVADLL